MDEEVVHTPLTFNQTLNGLLEFVEVAIHSILYVRQVYPADLFVRRQKYDTPVFQSRHPALNEYISGAVKAIGEEFIFGNIDKVVVVIKDKENVALERFIFSMQNMVHVENFNKDSIVEGAMTPTTLGQYFRSFIIKLNMVESQLALLDLRENVTFAIVVELKDGAPSESHEDEPPPWVPADVQHTTPGCAETAQLHFLRTVETGIINLSLAVQESEEKLRRLGGVANKSARQKGKGKERAL